MQDLFAATDRRLGKSRTTADLSHRPRTVKFTLKTLEGTVNEFAFFYLYNDHFFCGIYTIQKTSAKVHTPRLFSKRLFRTVRHIPCEIHFRFIYLRE